jgi:hypothetical protein
VPRKVFVAGEILTAADLQANAVDQSVMVFDDAAARTTAIPSPIQGMVTYLKSTDKLEKYTTDWVDAAPQKIVQIVSTTKTDTFSGSVVEGAETEVTGLTASITPTSTSSKIFVLLSLTVGTAEETNDPSIFFSIFRGATKIALADAAGNRQRVYGGADGSTNSLMSQSGTFLDSPNTTSSTTYSVKVSHARTETSTMYVNRSRNNDDLSRRARGVSTITLMEVAG